LAECSIILTIHSPDFMYGVCEPERLSAVAEGSGGGLTMLELTPYQLVKGITL